MGRWGGVGMVCSDCRPGAHNAPSLNKSAYRWPAGCCSTTCTPPPSAAAHPALPRRPALAGGVLAALVAGSGEEHAQAHIAGQRLK